MSDESVSNSEQQDYTTPLQRTSVLTRRNLLEALTGSGVQVSKQEFSIAQQKNEQKAKMEQQKLDKLLDTLTDRRDLIMEKMMRIQASLAQETVHSIYYLNLQQETIRRCYDDYEKVHSEICGLVQKDMKDDLRVEYLNFERLHEKLYVNVQTLIAGVQRMELAPNMQNVGESNVSRPQAVNAVPHLQVPLPTFDGKLENWYSFKCMFQTIMNRYPSESPAIKLYHLKNSLIGSAAGKIDQDVINNNNYESAWKMLEDAYEDERLIIDTHIDALLDLPKVTKENGDELRKLVEVSTKHVDALKNRDFPVEGLSEMILVNIVSKHLDRESRKLWESSLSREELPSFGDLMEFVRERTDTSEKRSDSSHSSSSADPVPAENMANSEQRTVSCCTQTTMKQIFLSTAMVLVSGSGNVVTTCRALQDCCSESNVITEKLAAKLKIVPMELDPPIVICGLNNMKTTTNKLIQTKVSSRDGKYNTMLDFLVTPAITELPTGKFETQLWPLPPAIELADPTFNVPADIDMIIGAEVFYDVLKKGRMKLGVNLPMLAETVFGWVVSGPVKTSKQIGQKRICQMNITHEDVNRTLSRFWELETCYTTTMMTAAERAVEKHFHDTHIRGKDGRYIVRIPFNDLKGQLGDSFENARRRFGKLMVSFAKNPQRRGPYAQFMQEYEALGHMKKDSSSTTKLRVVFDASAASTSGVSLNDTQLVGPTVQSDLVTIILRFCTHQIVLTGDIPKMYRQVQVHEADRKFQRILWLNEMNQMTVFELATVTYGCSSAPYLATRVLMQLASDEAMNFPIASRVVKEDSYIDDFLTGGKTAAEVVDLFTQLKQMLSLGGFGIHKICSNSKEVLKNVPLELQETRMDFEKSNINDAIKTLGLIWHPDEDYFVFHVPPLESSNSRPTKRIVLSEIGRLFDPLGFLGPVITLAKLTMQDLWRLQLDWEDELPEDQMAIWLSFREQLVSVRNIKKKRCVIPCDVTRIELHGFCDASRRAYGACLYTRSEFKDGSISVQLVCSKSKVSPLKPVTIPKLELCAALVLAQLTQKTMKALNVHFDSVSLWSDSQIVLSCLKKSPMALNEFVCNRVANIVELTQNYQWYYFPDQLLENERWWRGSPELWQPGISVVSTIAVLKDEELPEIKVSKQVLISTERQPPFNFTRLSSFKRLQRAWAYVRRFITNARSKIRNTEPLSANELDEAARTIFKLVQRQAFPELQKQLKAKSIKRNEYAGLAPFLDSEDCIRVGGRLKNSCIPYEGRHQILLPHKHHVTDLVIRYLHERNFHVGRNALLSIVRHQLWPVRATSAIKRVVGRCYRCFKYKPKPLNQFMGDLPSYRVTPAEVFAKTGVDYAGPFMLKDSGRKPRVYKAYVAVFICMVVKAVHLELVTDLRAETFIGALQRFVSRRGLPSDVYSDNGTTFVGANHELAAWRDLFTSQQLKDKLSEYCSSNGITWHFIPPRSPHFGGIWEAGVKTMKYHLKRVVGETRLTYEEMATFLAECEAIMNSRPLIPLSDDPNDLQALTPSHFLIMRPSQAVPEPSYKEEKIGRLSRWQHVQLMREHLWKRWSADYLHTLQTRQKWKDGVVDIRVGALVLLRDDNAPPQQWKLGRITSTIPGKDGIVRVVSVKTATGEYDRAVTKISLLPVIEPDDSTGGE
ncbi:uncharacterized protein LOC131433883 [Malaya genurostris]|uniref:uncharacterized protein LOC131433883 n=1 Tax=Malaya genurostris TaxID=325434 RepID=UPI0026F3D1EC|nr:uncharacterized protein LOC131433883 [Malaya genurostris]